MTKWIPQYIDLPLFFFGGGGNKLSTSTPLVLGWVMGDEAEAARARVQKYMSPTVAAAALDQRTKTANDFLTTQVPQLSVTLDPTRSVHTAQAQKRSWPRSGRSNGGPYPFHGGMSLYSLCEKIVPPLFRLQDSCGPAGVCTGVNLRVPRRYDVHLW